MILLPHQFNPQNLYPLYHLPTQKYQLQLIIKINQIFPRNTIIDQSNLKLIILSQIQTNFIILFLISKVYGLDPGYCNIAPPTLTISPHLQAPRLQAPLCFVPLNPLHPTHHVLQKAQIPIKTQLLLQYLLLLESH